MTAEQLLLDLRALGIRLSVEGDRLRCNAPKGTLTPEIEERIATYKPDLIQALQRPPSHAFSLPKRPAAGSALPLSFAQERFWFLQSFDPELTAYDITASHRVRGWFNPQALESSLAATLRKHEVLRTRFPVVDGTPTQLIMDEVRPAISCHDLRYLHGDDRERAIDSVVHDLSRKPFDLAQGPLLRVAFLNLGDEDQKIVLTIHHMICDGWSIGIFFNELISLYERQVRGESSTITNLPIQYRDYVLWERARHESGALNTQIDYWRTKLKDAPPYLDLPLDRERKESSAYHAALQRFQLDESTSESLRRVARQQRATLFMTLLAVFDALLCRYTGQDDILVGTPVSTRTLPEFEQLIGCFINTHVLRARLTPGITARELVAQTRETVLESLNHPDVPFETLVSELVIRRDLVRSPLFQVAFILQNTPMASQFDVISGGSALDMTLYMWEAGGSIGGCLEYNTDLFTPETISRFVECLKTLAAGMAEQPDAAIEMLPLLTPEQQKEWFATDHGLSLAFPKDQCAHQLIERQAAETPDAIAVVSGDETLTYRELSEASNRLANRLRALGVGPDSLVALCLDRSVDLAVAPLAVWKAGGAYLPLDPEYPQKRLAFMLADSGASILVTHSRLLNRMPREISKVLCLDRDRQLLARQSAQAPVARTTGENIAYTIYTSGSTGQPKGVEIRHRSLVNFLLSMQREPGMEREDSLLAVTTLSFDIAGLELYLPLITGARVVIAPRDTVVDGSALAEMLQGSAISVMQATPATWRLMLESGWKGTPGLKILCGGETLPRDLADQLLSCGAELWNLYGPTETTIWSTLQRITPGNGRVPIGRPIANTQIYVMDRNRQPVPPGVTGELYIGGEGLARGYLGREELTAERFVEHPSQPGERLYRTGDLVRRVPDGSFECIARIDNQIKLRGFRIEPGEIEAALEQQAGIREAVIVVREDLPGDQRLTAYLRTEGLPIDPKALRKALSAGLPEHMIPAAFVKIEEFPLTPNRKVDRKAMLAPEYAPRQAHDGTAGEPQEEHQLEPATGSNPPRNQVEAVMVDIWKEVLAIEQVEIADNFFDLGGHSLSAARLIARLRSALGIDLPLRSIFLEPTIEGLARHIVFDSASRRYRYTSDIPQWSVLVPAQPKGSKIPFFFVGGHQGPDDTLLVLSRLFPHLGKDQPVFGLRPRWIEGEGDEYHSVDEMAREFLAQIRGVQAHGPYLLGGYCVGGIAALEVARLLRSEGEDVKLLLLLDTERPTRIGAVLTEFLFLRQRLNHMADVASEIIRPGRRSRIEMIQDLIRRKVRIASAKPQGPNDRFYKAKIRYQRMLYCHHSEQYPGRITVIVNEERSRSKKDLGWSGFAREGLDVHTVPGNHDTILTQYGKQVAQYIVQSIEESVTVVDHEENRAEVTIS